MIIGLIIINVMELSIRLNYYLQIRYVIRPFLCFFPVVSEQVLLARKVRPMACCQYHRTHSL